VLKVYLLYHLLYNSYTYKSIEIELRIECKVAFLHLSILVEYRLLYDSHTFERIKIALPVECKVFMS
jgi:hypothetical protein